MPIDYGERVPTLEQFKHDSSVPMAVRAKDTVLAAIDARLAEYGKRPLNRFEVMVDLFENRDVTRCGEASLIGFAPFVMSMERVFYMARQYLPERDGLGDLNARFHSTYFGNDCRVSAAGTMLVKNGEVRAIRGDSGHYMPGEHNLAQAIRALQGYGVNIDRLRVYSWRANPGSKQGTVFQQDHFMLSNAPHSMPAVLPRAAPVVVNYGWADPELPGYDFAPTGAANGYSRSPGDGPAYGRTPANYHAYGQTPANGHQYDQTPSGDPQPVSGTHYLRSHI